MSYLRPHIRLYHTIVPCRWCEDCGICCCCGSGAFIWIDVCIGVSDCWLMPIEELPKVDGFMPPHGTPTIGVGSSGGVTLKNWFWLIFFQLWLPWIFDSDKSEGNFSIGLSSDVYSSRATHCQKVVHKTPQRQMNKFHKAIIWQKVHNFLYSCFVGLIHLPSLRLVSDFMVLCLSGFYDSR